MAIVASTSQKCSLYGFDLWVENYGNMSNPRPDFGRSEFSKVGFFGKLEFINGDSHYTLPKFLNQNPNIYFDIFTVEGDHSERGAIEDILQLLPRLTIGGVIVFEDITHPRHPSLMNVWTKCVKSNNMFNTWGYTDLGYGVAVGVRISK